jgi:hypothetical protein
VCSIKPAVSSRFFVNRIKAVDIVDFDYYYRAMRENIGPPTERETIIEDLRTRLKNLRAEGYPTDPQIYLLQKALRLEKTVLKAESRDVSDFFTTGYAGRRVILWRFTDGDWTGRLCNYESGKLKKESAGKTAEQMLRGLMPTK